MQLNTLRTQALAGFTALITAFAAHAGVSAAEAAKLGATLTPIGAEAAGNKAGTIPAWTGEKNFPADVKTMKRATLEDWRKNKPDQLEAKFKEGAGADVQKILFTITKANMDQYKANLTEGHKALFGKYPDYKMNVYRTVRTAYWPKEVEAATKLNATTATLNGTDDVKGAKLGFPFPIPKSGAEVIWNHKLKFRGTSAKRFNNQAIVKPDGGVLVTKLVEDVKFKYATLVEPGDGSVYTYYMSEVLSPPRVAGTITLVHETSDTATGGRSAWLFSPGLGRVTKAPDVGFDNPALGTDNEQYNDQIDVFNGSLSRYDWKLVGKKEMYIPYNSFALNSPKLKYAQILTKFHINQDYPRYELHRVWVVDATLKAGTSHNFKRRTFYVDEDSWSIAVVDDYDKRDQIWKVQEAHLLTAPFIPTTTGLPELIYDLQSGRYFATTLVNEDPSTDWEQTYDDKYFDPANLKRKAKNK